MKSFLLTVYLFMPHGEAFVEKHTTPIATMTECLEAGRAGEADIRQRHGNVGTTMSFCRLKEGSK